MRDVTQNLFLFLTAIVLSANPSRSYANVSWSDEATALIEEFNSQEPRFPNPHASTLWGAIRGRTAAANLALRDLAKPSKVTVSVLVDGETHQFELPIILVRQKNSLKPVPLMVSVPGIFSNIRDPSNLRALGSFYSRGYDVLLVPNPWGTEYIEAKPPFAPGTLDEEAGVLRQLINHAISVIGKTHIRDISFHAESYGAFLTAVALAQETEPNELLLNGQVPLVAPPRYIDRALKRLDQLMDETKTAYLNKCRTAMDNFSLVLEYYTVNKQSELSQLSRDCGPSLLAYGGFQRGLIDAVLALHRARGTGEVVRPKAKGYQAWSEKLRFAQAIHDHAPENETRLSDPELVSLNYWLKKAAANGFTNIRVVTAKDDILNRANEWKTQPDETDVNVEKDSDFMNVPVAMLAWGGHMGFEADHWYEKFLDNVFGPRLSKLQKEFEGARSSVWRQPEAADWMMFVDPFREGSQRLVW